jgi:hypothetical protein
MSQEPRPHGAPPSRPAGASSPSHRAPARRGPVRASAKRAVQFAWLLVLLTFLFGLVHSRDGDELQFPAAMAWGLSGLLASALTAAYWLVTRVLVSVRRALVAIAVVATLLAVGIELTRRRARFLAIEEAHAGSAGLEGTLVITDEGPAYVGLRTEKGRWHEMMRRKYDYHARHPWLPVPPDPREPE